MNFHSLQQKNVICLVYESMCSGTTFGSADIRDVPRPITRQWQGTQNRTLISRGRSRKAFPPHRNRLAWIVMTIAVRGEDRSSLGIARSGFLESADANCRDHACQKDPTESNHHSNQASGEANWDQVSISDG
jgi:hypothetical protein